MVFLTENWFWRGTQSAIFYYASCAPWLEYKYKRRRKQDAARKTEDKELALIAEQPGMIVQPAPFQTNDSWAQEILNGPGPPKGWQRDPIYYKHNSTSKREQRNRPRADTDLSTNSPAKSDWTAGVSTASTAAQPCQHVPLAKQESLERAASWLPDLKLPTSPFVVFDGPTRSSWPGVLPDPNRQRSKSLETDTTGSRPSSDSDRSVENQTKARPSMEKRMSTAMDGFKDAMKAALHPDRWNWILYDRDDEILPNLNERMKSIWNNVKTNMEFLNEDTAAKLKQLEPQEDSRERDVQSWRRGQHPAVNDLHPPIVSQLPYTREEAKWMLLPAPSADVMMGRRRPDPFDDTKRKPLCIIGREPVPVPQPILEQPEQDKSDEESDGGYFHVQKPQRAHLLPPRRHSLSPGDSLCLPTA